MNLPSLDKYEDDVVPGGKIFVDSTLIERKVNRTDVEVHYIPATKLANDIEAPTLANMIMIGKVIKETGVVPYDNIDKALDKVVSARKAALKEINFKALDTGYNN